MKKINNFLKILPALFILSGSFFNAFAQSSSGNLTIDLKPGEKIWSGAIMEGDKMPLPDNYQFDFYANNNSNQLQPLLISNQGLYVWSEEPYKFEIKNNQLLITDNYHAVKTGRYGKTLAQARQYASQNFFPASGKIPDSLLFTKPQYNTWIELNFHQNQADVLKYARAIVSNGLPAGVIMIDDTWQEDYGVWKFHPGRFPDPKSMMNELHQLGFKVMLWVCPFVSADQFLLYNSLKKKKAFLMEKKKDSDTWESSTEPAMIRWWDGVSAELDFTNPEAVNWFNEQLDWLRKEYGVDGFKFDAADMQFYPPEALSMKPLSPNAQCALYTQFGLRYPLNEYRACWKTAGQPLAQRLLDKNHTWADLQLLIPHMVAEGLAGYTFSCPDMIGGGMLSSFENLDAINQELVVRSAQCHALMPMMQFSVAPWRILDKENFGAIKKSVELRQKFIPHIMKLVRKSAQTGEPIMTNLDYYFPGQELEMIHDQFMLGDDLLVAPMVKAGNSRTVVLPKGKWKADDGMIYKGGQTYTINVPLERLPYFELLGGNVARIENLSFTTEIKDADYIFHAPDPVSFGVGVINNNKKNMDVIIHLDITTDDHRPAYSAKEKLSLKPGQRIQKSFTFPKTEPGFYRSYAYVEFEGNKTKPVHTIVGYEPEKIKAPVDAKPDFESFWKNNLAELAAINPDYKLTLQPELSNNDYEVYIVEMNSFGNERVKSYYAKPKREGKFPVSVEFQGYGSGPYPPSTNWDGFAHMLVSVRGQALNKPGPNKYGDWIVYGLESKENYYYRGAFLDLVRGIDFVCSRPEIDTSKIAAQGYSQGGAFTFIASALDKRIKAAVPGEPFLSDYPNYFKIVGWPKMSFDNYMKEHPEATWDKVFDVLSYFDIKNFAPWIKCPLWMGMAVQDETCPGRVNFAAYNHVSSPKKWTAFPTEGHVWIPGFHQGWIDFFKESMKLK